jgi:hypothetical protein
MKNQRQHLKLHTFGPQVESTGTCHEVSVVEGDSRTSQVDSCRTIGAITRGVVLHLIVVVLLRHIDDLLYCTDGELLHCIIHLLVHIRILLGHLCLLLHPPGAPHPPPPPTWPHPTTHHLCSMTCN